MVPRQTYLYLRAIIRNVACQDKLWEKARNGLTVVRPFFRNTPDAVDLSYNS